VINLTLLGSTGSIGTQTLDVVRRNRDRYRVEILATNTRLDLLAEQVAEFQPSAVVVGREDLVDEAVRRLGGTTRVLGGSEGLIEASTRSDIDVVVTALVGASGLAPTLAAAQSGKRIALANKEALVVAGELICTAARAYNASIIPVDSEHSAVFQSLIGEDPATVEEVILTASGGPFRDLAADLFSTITPEQALLHPNWSMGPKITIDSATMMNKGLEVIEARWLFDLAPSRIRVVVHPESIIHSMVQFVDGSVKAQMGLPDMRLPIQFALAWPDRLGNDFARLSLPALGRLTFHDPDIDKFPALRLAYEALERGGTAPAVLNAANEVAVMQFLARELSFDGIPAVIERALRTSSIVDNPTFDDILQADARTREELRSYLAAPPPM